jgi:hypothetical protein
MWAAVLTANWRTTHIPSKKIVTFPCTTPNGIGGREQATHTTITITTPSIAAPLPTAADVVAPIAAPVVRSPTLAHSAFLVLADCNDHRDRYK